MTPPPPPPRGTDPYTPGTGAPVDIRPHGRGERSQQHQTRQVEEPSARRGGKQSKGGKLGHILQGKQGPPMLLRQMFLTGSDRALPHRASFDWATPQPSHLQMDVDHMYIQRRLDPHLTDRAKTRGIVRAPRRRHSMSGP